MCTATSSHSDLDVLLRGFLAGDPASRQLLPKAAKRYVLKIVRRLAGDLPEDIQEEVVTQAFENLLRQRPGAYLPGRGSAGTFLKFMVRAAARQVRASYAPPGNVTRARRKKAGVAKASAVQAVLCIDAVHESELPTHEGGLAATEAKLDVQAMLSLVSSTAANSLRAVFLQEQPLEAVAEEAGMSRFRMSRMIRQSLEDLKAAA